MLLEQTDSKAFRCHGSHRGGSQDRPAEGILWPGLVLCLRKTSTKRCKLKLTITRAADHICLGPRQLAIRGVHNYTQLSFNNSDEAVKIYCSENFRVLSRLYHILEHAIDFPS